MEASHVGLILLNQDGNPHGTEIPVQSRQCPGQGQGRASKGPLCLAAWGAAMCLFSCTHVSLRGRPYLSANQLQLEAWQQPPLASAICGCSVGETVTSRPRWVRRVKPARPAATVRPQSYAVRQRLSSLEKPIVQLPTCNWQGQVQWSDSTCSAEKRLRQVASTR